MTPDSSIECVIETTPLTHSYLADELHLLPTQLRHPEGPRSLERAEGSRANHHNTRAPPRDPSLRLKSGFVRDDSRFVDRVRRVTTQPSAVISCPTNRARSPLTLRHPEGPRSLPTQLRHPEGPRSLERAEGSRADHHNTRVLPRTPPRKQLPPRLPHPNSTVLALT
jgi:hypothetical protein